MRPREWVGCVVGVRYPDGRESVATVRRAWRGARTGRLLRVEIVSGTGEARAARGRWRVARVDRVAGGVPERTLVLGGAW